MSKELGDNIRRLRKQAGLRQYQLSIKMNVTAQTVSSWECGVFGLYAINVFSEKLSGR